jgi:putative Mg2+ transporter-C (MgtC) family protein
LLRIAAAILAGAAIGWDRETTGKQAGLRTHILVALGAALFVLSPLVLAGSPSDVSRVVQGVATGIGFLGAGDIVRRQSVESRSGDADGSDEHRRQPKETVRGLTSAAAIWVTAALGLLAGAGSWRTSSIGAAGALITLRVLKRLER